MDTSQESETFETDEAYDAASEAEQQTSSPDVTDGGSSSDPAVEPPEDNAEAIRDAFLKEYGDPTEEEAETEETVEAEAGDGEPQGETERSKASDTPEADDGDSDEFRISDEEFKALPDGARKRIGHLNARAKKAERQLQEVQPHVEKMEVLENFIRDNNIQPDNVTRAFNLMARLSHGDYEGFLQEVTPFVDMARQATGQTFAPDLQQQVDDGMMTEEAAKEITRQRIAQHRMQHENQQLKQAQEQQAQAQQRQQQVQGIQQAVAKREAELQQSDPDYAQLQEAVKRNVAYALQNGAVPQSVEQAVNMVNQAYEMAKASAPKPEARPTPRRPSASQTPRGRQAPASTKDAIIGALESYTPG